MKARCTHCGQPFTRKGNTVRHEDGTIAGRYCAKGDASTFDIHAQTETILAAMADRAAGGMFR